MTEPDKVIKSDLSTKSSLGDDFHRTALKHPKRTKTFLKSKVSMCIIHAPLWPKYLSISFYDKMFMSYSIILRKVHLTAQTRPDIFKVKTIPTNILQSSVFKFTPNFEKSAMNDLNIP